MAAFEDIQSRESGLHKHLTAGQMSMIAIGGAIGTGLFLGSKLAIELAGPGVIISYVVGGVIALLLMGCLAEMTVHHATSGSFGAYAEHYISPFAGYIVRFTYFACVTLGAGTEVTAIATYMGFWFPHVPGIIWVVGSGVLLVAVNARNVETFGSVEYFLSGLKILAIIGFILLGVVLLIQAHDPAAIHTNVLGHGGFFPKGAWGVWEAVFLAIFSYFSLEMIAIAAAESTNPEHSIKKAFKQTIARLIIFYFCTLALIVILVPWPDVIGENATSPFVTVMAAVHIPVAATILNVVVVIASLSSTDSMLYVAARMMFSLSRGGYAPKVFGKVYRNGVPLNALWLATAGIAVATVTYALNPEKAFPIMIATSSFGALTVWGMIFVTHLFFRTRIHRQHEHLRFRIPGFPFTSLLGAGLILAVLITSWFTDLFHATLLFGVPFMAFLMLSYVVYARVNKR
ncbi:MAG TPA: amino acid permease [Nevskiaceae bacterium]